MSAKTLEDKDISKIIGNILRIGVYIALSVTFVGGLLYLTAKGDHEGLQHSVFVEKNENLWQYLRTTMNGVLRGDGLSVISFGILLLIATPLTRVLFSLVAFFLEKDRMYVIITIIVLVIIMVSILTGFGG